MHTECGQAQPRDASPQSLIGKASLKAPESDYIGPKYLSDMQERLPQGTQTNFRSILTDGLLRVEGSNGSIFAIGDASSIAQAGPCRMLRHSCPLLSHPYHCLSDCYLKGLARHVNAGPLRDPSRCFAEAGRNKDVVARKWVWTGSMHTGDLACKHQISAD